MQRRARSRILLLLSGPLLAALPAPAAGLDLGRLVASPWGVYIVFALAIAAVIVLLLWAALGEDNADQAKREAHAARRARLARKPRAHRRFAGSRDRIAWPRR
jgi:hypothetical protein